MADAVIGQVKAVLTADTKGLDTGLQRASSRLTSFGKSATQVGKTLSTRLTLPLVAAGAAAIKTAADFEKSMASIVGLVGVAADEVKAMESSVRDMAKTFGSSASEAGKALFFITSAGLRGADATDTLEASLKAAAVGLGDVSTIADLATSALNAYGSDTLSATAATDVLTAAVREGKLEASELAASMGGVLPIASAMGVQFHEVGAAFAALSRTGTNAAEATTQINGILSALLKPTMQAESALRTMGLSSEFLRSNLAENGLLDTLQLLAEEFDGNAAATASVFGNVRALKGVMDLMGANVEGTIAIFNAMADTTGTVDAAFEVMAETASFKFSKAMAEAKDSLLTVGQAAMPIATQAAEALAGVLGGLGALFGSLGEGTQQIIISLGGVAAIAGPVALAIGGVAKAIGAMTAAAAAHPVLAAMTVAISGVAVVMGQIRAEAKRAAERQESLTEAFKEAGDPATVVVDKLNAIAESMSLISGATKTAEQDFSEFLGDVVLMTELASLEATGAFGKLGESGQDALRALAESDTNLRDLGFVTNVQDMTTALDLFEAGVEDNVGAAGELAAELYLLADSGEVTVEELDAILIALDRTNQAYKDHHKAVAENNKEYVTSGEIFQDFAGIINDDILASLVAGAEKTGDYSGMLEELNTLASHAQYIQSLLGTEVQATAVQMSATSLTANDMARALSEAGEMAGYDKRQIRDLAEQMRILDKIDPSVMVELGLDIMGGEQVLALVDKLIAIQGADFFKTGLPEFGIPPALQGLMDLRTALELALEAPAPSGGGGGGGSSTPASEAIDEVAQAAELAQRQADQLSHAVNNLGNSLMGRDFAEELFGATPDELADIFEKLVGQLDELGLVTEENAPTIAALGEQFKAAASAAEELAQATADLAEAQDVLDQKRQVVKDIRDDYKDFRDEFFTPARDDGLVGILGGRGSGLDLIVEQLETALPKLREAQNKFQNLLAQRDQYKQSVADLFRPQLSADGNVMAQTQRLLGQARQFRDNIIALRDKGFPPDVIAEVVNAGLQGGAKLGSQLLRMGTGEMSQFLSMREEIARLGAQTSKVAADVLFSGDIREAEDAFKKQRGLVAQLFQSAMSEARKQAEDQEKVVNGLKEALEAATAQMEQLVNNIQVNLFNAFNNFLSKIGGEVTALTATPYVLDVDLSAIDRLANMIADLTGTPTPVNPTPLKPKPGDNGKRPPKPGEKGPIPRPTPEQTITVNAGDGGFRLLSRLGVPQTSANMKKLWEHNGLWFTSTEMGEHATIFKGNILRVPAFANGGYARKGMPHLVGERGAELFVPDSSGYVVPNHALGGGSQTVNVTINTHAGMRAEDIVREIEKYTRRRGQVAIPTTGNRRF